MILRNIFIFLLFTGTLTLKAQEEDALYIKKIYDHTLTKSTCYEDLRALTEVGGRLAGSKAYDDAVDLTKAQMERMGFDTVYLQPCDVMGWERKSEVVKYDDVDGEPLSATALGNSIGTGPVGFSAEVIEVQSLEEVKKLGKEGVAGKIVFYNRPMDPTQIRTFNAYGGAVDQRVYGAARAAEYGAVAAVVRSMTLRYDDYPHTGTMAYKDGIKKIPSLALSTMASDQLSQRLKEGSVKLYIQNECSPTELKQTHSVIGEIKGSQYPDEIIVVGGHLDAWDIGNGAHDDGAGCVQSMQVLQTLADLDYQPKRTIRVVLFANEENGLAGGRKYAKVSNENEEYHMAALESDSGGFSPRGFSFDGHADVLEKHYKKVYEWLPLFESLGLTFKLGGSGSDIGPLKSQKGILIGLRPDSQRYFDYHHTSIDNFEAVNKRELELGAAAMTALIYMLDKYGL